MLTELRLEIKKLLHKPRTYIGPVGTTVLVIITLLAVKYGNEFSTIEARLAQDFIMVGSLRNASFLASLMLTEFIVYMLLPIFVCTVFGDLVASEVADGTLRMLLCRPITRLRLLMSKYGTGILYTLMLTYGMGIFAYLLGLLFLGRGSLINLADGIWILPERMALIRLATAYGLTTLGMIAIGSIAFAISTFLSNSNGAVAGAVSFVIGCKAIEQFDFFRWLKPYLLTSYLEPRRILVSRLDTAFICKSVEVMLAYSAIAIVVGMIIFHERDIMS